MSMAMEMHFVLGRVGGNYGIGPSLVGRKMVISPSPHSLPFPSLESVRRAMQLAPLRGGVSAESGLSNKGFWANRLVRDT